MKTNLTLKALAIAFFASALGTLNVLAEVREEFHQTYPLEAQGRVQLENVNGAVHISTWDRAEVQVDAVKRAKTQEHLDGVKIEIDSKPDHLRVQTQYPKNQKNNSTSVEYRLTVPRQSHLSKVSTVNGAVEVSNAGGDVEASAINGAVSATGLSGETHLETVNGSVKAVFASLKAPVSLKAVNGSVTIALPADVNADVSADTLHGGISSDFDLKAQKEFPVGQKLHGQLGQGGPAVKLSTTNGGIRVMRATAAEAEER